LYGLYNFEGFGDYEFVDVSMVQKCVDLNYLYVGFDLKNIFVSYTVNLLTIVVYFD
ncbi:14100_t:CDS:2, partial [Racocetra fulgida]